MNLIDLSDRVKAAVDSDPVLAEAIEARIVFGIPKQHPAVYVDGLYDLDDSKGASLVRFTINLTHEKNGIAEAATFFDLAGRLKAALNGSQSIIGGSWLDRSEETIHRAMFDCQTWL
ncbi:hypothetical protein [Sphingobium sp. LSP13-1-1.1]|uniref:hypothetical protein n=1 Tax=Sphingobium sp. LSP13-1-1.1 TaxID=3135234 RepID=UPI00343824F5